MNTYLYAGLRALGWSLFIVLSGHFILLLNPFQGTLLSLLLLVLLISQLFLLRKKGLLYIGLFVLFMIAFTGMLQYASRQIFDTSMRYYSTN